MMETIIIICAIVIILLFMPWFLHVANLFIGTIPTYLLVFMNLALIIKFILFVIHRGDNS